MRAQKPAEALTVSTQMQVSPGSKFVAALVDNPPSGNLTANVQLSHRGVLDLHSGLGPLTPGV